MALSPANDRGDHEEDSAVGWAYCSCITPEDDVMVGRMERPKGLATNGLALNAPFLLALGLMKA